MKAYSREEMKKIITNGSNLSSASIYKNIHKMISSGKLCRVGYGQYVLNNKQKYDYDLSSKTALSIFRILEKQFGKATRYIVYESSILNAFLNHLIGKSTIIVEVEKDLAEPVFWFLKKEGFQNILFNPSENENYIYNPYDGSGVIVKTMVSRSPIDNKHHKITLEKLAVDIVCDKTLNMFFESAEMPHMVEDILENYAVRFDSVKNYAKRRHCLDRFIKYVPKTLRGVFND